MSPWKYLNLQKNENLGSTSRTHGLQKNMLNFDFKGPKKNEVHFKKKAILKDHFDSCSETRLFQSKYSFYLILLVAYTTLVYLILTYIMIYIYIYTIVPQFFGQQVLHIAYVSIH